MVFCIFWQPTPVRDALYLCGSPAPVGDGLSLCGSPALGAMGGGLEGISRRGRRSYGDNALRVVRAHPLLVALAVQKTGNVLALQNGKCRHV